jgi:uncharacterized protein YecE (DUF72 family)
MPACQVRIGCAGWNIPKDHASSFPSAGSHLERYARRFSAVEINSSFYRPHRFDTYRRWADSVPDGFEFSVKLPKEITHRRRLVEMAPDLDAFLNQTAGLGEKIGPLLIQLPPSLGFEPDVVRAFFVALRTRFAGGIVCEPRHPNWFTEEADELLRSFQVGRVAADPPIAVQSAVPGGWNGIAYIRLHGSPRTYYSSYDDAAIDDVAHRLVRIAADGRRCWCIFDNTALGAATANALALQERLCTIV